MRTVSIHMNGKQEDTMLDAIVHLLRTIRVGDGTRDRALWFDKTGPRDGTAVNRTGPKSWTVAFRAPSKGIPSDCGYYDDPREAAIAILTRKHTPAAKRR